MTRITLDGARHRRRAVIMLLTLGGTLLTGRTLMAQSIGEESAYRALIYTPVAGLPPLPPVTDSLGHHNGSGITLLGRLGHMSRQGGLSLTTYGVGVEVPRGRMRLGATFAYLSASCTGDWIGDPDCSGDIMLGGSIRTLITEKPLSGDEPRRAGKRSSKSSDDGKFVVGFDGSVGYSPRQGTTAMAAEASAPTGVAFRSGTVRIMPFVTPGLAFGRISNEQYPDEEVATAHSSIVFTVGGGLGLQFGTSGIGANVGFKRVLKGYGGTTQIGVGMTWQGLTSAR